MKAHILLLLILAISVFSVFGDLQTSGIRLVSEQNLLTYRWSESYFDLTTGQSYNDSGEGQTSQPEIQVQTPHGWASASLSCREFTNFYTAHAVASAAQIGNMIVDRAYIRTDQSTTWTFFPSSSCLAVSMSFQNSWNYWSSEQGFFCSLTDQVSNTVLWEITPQDSGVSFYTNFFSVSPEHSYELQVQGFGIAYDAKYIRQSFSAELTSVPEPGAMALIITLGGICACTRYRRFSC